MSQSSSTSRLAATSTTTTPTTTRPAAVELRSEFLLWVAPIDFEEATAGWEAFGLPDQQRTFMAMAACWEENGYGEFAGHLRSQSLVMPGGFGNDLLTPMSRLTNAEFTDEPDSWVRLIPESAGPRGLPGALELLFTYGPDVGLRADDVAGIRSVGQMCWPEGWSTTTWMGLPEDVEVQWITRLAELDREPELATLIQETVTPCLRAVDPYFDEAIDPGDWMSRAMWAPDGPDAIEGYDSEKWAMPEETLVEWGRGFASCMMPLEEARRAPRLAARQAWVEEWHDVLIEFQAAADAELEPGT